MPTGHGVMCWLTSSWTCFARPLVAILCLSGSHNEFVRCIMPPHPQPALAFGHPIPGRPVRGCDCTTHPATQDLLVGARIPGPGDRLRPMIRWRSQGPLKDAQGATAKRLF